MKKRGKINGFVKNHRLLFGFILIVILGVLIFLGTQLYLYIQFIIGNDLVVKMSASNTSLNLSHGDNSSLFFDFSAVASPLCSVRCSSYFLDIGEGVVLSNESFDLTPGITRRKSFDIFANRLGVGQDSYRFVISCYNKKSLFCHTDEKPIERTSFVVVNRDLNQEEKLLKKEIKDKLELLESNFEYFNASYFYFQNISSYLNKTLLIDFNITNESFNVSRYLDFWNNEDYYELRSQLASVSISNQTNLSEVFYVGISRYNSLVENLFSIYNNLSQLSGVGFSASDRASVQVLFDEFSGNISLFSSINSISEKEKIISGLSSLNYSSYLNRVYVNETLEKLNISLNFNLSKIDSGLAFFNFSSNFSLGEPKEKCCVFGNCSVCVKSERYPILFIHGHDFNKGVSADYSLNAFSDLQNNLENISYLNAGELSLGGAVPIVNTNWPISVRGSYYFDFFKKANSSVIVQAKSEGIDSYSIRLRELINDLKLESGKDKIIIVAHSMGGLVARRYVQVFGGESVDKLILIGTPNYGVRGSVANYCSVFGSQEECGDLEAGSLFLNKLNDGNIIVPTYNIMGSGCDMNGEQGDGIVLNKDGFLEGANNYYINGSCSGVNLLHGEMLETSKYPEIYNLMKQII